jgi:methionyl-tRNA formyltransferase
VIQPEDLRTVFMGTPDFALPTLKSLIELGLPVVAAFTQPDRPKGRGKSVTPPPVKCLAQELKIPVFQPGRLREPAAVEELKSLAPDLIVVVAYGQILPQSVLDIPRFGCINVHASLLPRYRGAAPINKEIMEGEKETGITTMYMDAGLDTGDMLVKRTAPIGFEETAGELHDRLAVMGGEVIAATIERLCRDELEPVAQDDSLSSYAPMLKKEDGLIDWTRSASTLHNLVRGLDPWPGAFCRLHGQLLKIFHTLPEQGGTGKPGRIVAADGEGVRIACGEGVLLIRELQLAGKKRLPAADFLKGQPLSVGDTLE